jgi:intracellular septation protein A
MDRQRVRGGLRFLGETFAPLVVFYAFEHLVSLLAAIIAGIVCGLAIVAMQLKREKKASGFTIFVAASVIGFGILDLRYQTGFFVKLEPALGNAITGLFFVGSVLWGKPVIIEFAERGLGRKMDKARGYLTLWTVLWGVFFFLRSGTYVWMAYNVSLDRALVIRGVT